MSSLANAVLELAPLMSQAQIARKLSITEGYVSQILAKESLSSKIVEAKLKYLDEATQRDQRLNEVEDALLARLKEMIPSFYKPKDVLYAFSAINKAVRRGATTEVLQASVADQETKVININLPQVIKQRYKINSKSEVIEVEGRPLVTADSKQLYETAMKEHENESLIPQRESSGAKLSRLSRAEIDLDAQSN